MILGCSAKKRISQVFVLTFAIIASKIFTNKRSYATRSSMEHLIQYALKDNRTVHISEVDSGLDCGCYCSYCNSQLIAKKGNIVVHHFAHYKSNECDKAYESALHAGVKRVLEKERRFLFPEVVGKDLFGNRIVIHKSIKLPVENIQVEEYLQGIIPDICISVGESKCLIEIFVSHKVDDQKIRKIEKLGIAAIEIDFSNAYREVDDDYILSILVNNEHSKRWLYNPKIVKWEQERKQKALLHGKADEFKIVTTQYCADSVFGCPLSGEYRGRLWKSANVNCSNCRFFLKRGNNSVLCCARFEIWNRSQEKQKSYYGVARNNCFINTKSYLNQVGVCPECGNLLIERSNESGFLRVCSGYPNCAYEQRTTR